MPFCLLFENQSVKFAIFWNHVRAVYTLVPKLNHTVVCAACKDQRCSVCPLASYGSGCCGRYRRRYLRRLSVFLLPGSFSRLSGYFLVMFS